MTSDVNFNLDEANLYFKLGDKASLNLLMPWSHKH